MEKRRYDSSIARIAGNIASGLAQRHPLHDAQFKDWARQCVAFAREIVAETIRTEPPATDAPPHFVTGTTVVDTSSTYERLQDTSAALPPVSQGEVASALGAEETSKRGLRNTGIASASGTEKFERMVRDARAQIAKGATHDCGEWIRDGACALCDRVMQ